jgi:hypothetical protein
MPATWGDTYGSTSNLFDLDLGQMLWGALRDRYAVLASSGVGASSLDLLTFPLPSDGDRAHRTRSGVDYLSALPSAAVPRFPVNQIQYLIEHALVPVFIDPRTLAALPATTKPKTWDDFEDFAEYVGLNDGAGDGWLRWTMRKITGTSATVDTDGNTIADGMKARSTADRANYVRTSGAWVRGSISDIPDRLKSTDAAPNHCAPGYSDPAKHDVIGPWVYNECVAALNKLYVTRRGFITTSNCDLGTEFKLGEGYDDYAPPHTSTPANAKSLAEEGWDNVTRFGGYAAHSYPESSAGNWSMHSYYSGVVGAEFQCYSLLSRGFQTGAGTFDNSGAVLYTDYVRVLASRLCFKAGITGKAHFLVKAHLDLGAGGIFTNKEFDTNSLVSTSNGEWGLHESKDVVTVDGGADDLYFDPFGDTSTKPAWATDNGYSPPQSTFRGAQFYFDVLVEWEFPQGDFAPEDDDAPTEITADCPSPICWYYVEAVRNCGTFDDQGRGTWDVSPVLDEDANPVKECELHKDSQWVDLEFDGDGNPTKKRRWVAGPACEDVDGCDDLTEEQLAAIAAGLLKPPCPVFTECSIGEDPPDTSDRTVVTTGAGDGPGGTIDDDCDDFDVSVTVTYRGGGFFADSVYDLTEGIYGTTLMCDGHWTMTVSSPSCGGASVTFDGPGAPDPDGPYTYATSTPGFAGGGGCNCSTSISGTVS